MEKSDPSVYNELSKADAKNLRYYILDKIKNNEKPNFGALETGARDYIPIEIYEKYAPELIHREAVKRKTIQEKYKKIGKLELEIEKLLREIKKLKEN